MANIEKIYDGIRDGALAWSRRWFGHLGEIGMMYIFLLPDLVRLMIRLLADTRVFLFDKIFIVGVLLYIISPIDLFPEIIAGPFGLVEDLLLTLVMLYRLLSNPYNHEAIQEHWKGDPHVIEKIQRGFQHIKLFMLKLRR